jgi:hypothetical protein
VRIAEGELIVVGKPVVETRCFGVLLGANKTGPIPVAGDERVIWPVGHRCNAVKVLPNGLCWVMGIWLFTYGTRDQLAPVLQGS